MTRTPPADRAWTLSRADLEGGAGALLGVSHPLLPEPSFAVPVDGGLRLGPIGPGPAALVVPVAETEARAYLTRLAGLCCFLRSAGLGVAEADVLRIGLARAADRPALAAPPVPSWRAAAPALVVAATAARLGGGPVAPAAGGAGLRSSVVRAVEGGLSAPFAEIAASALRCLETEGRPETLLLETDAEPSPFVAVDLLGFHLPRSAQTPAGEAGAASLRHGASALLLARGAARRARPGAGYVELSPGPALEQGAVFATAAAAIGDDATGRYLGSLGDGSGPVPPPLPLTLLGRDADRWDAASRRAWDRLAHVPGVQRHETRLRPPAPWEAPRCPEPSAELGTLSGIVWLPFTSLADAVRSWEALAADVRGDLDRLPAAARRLAEGFRPGRPARPSRGAVVTVPERSGVLDAASLLSPGFSVGEAAAGAGVGHEEAGKALGDAVADGLLVEVAPGELAFTDEGERRRRAEKVRPDSRRQAVERLSAASVPPDRMIVAALARGREDDVGRAGERLRSAAASGEKALAATLLAHAPGRRPDLGEPLAAARVFYASGAFEAARRCAGRVGPAEAGRLSAQERRRAAPLLARLGAADAALALLEGDATPAGALARAAALMEGRRDREARELLEGPPVRPLEELGVAERLRATHLTAELAARRLDLAAAQAGLEAVAVLLEGAAADRQAATDVAFSSGFLASDLGRFAEAALFFRRAAEEAEDAPTRADARADLSVALLHAGDYEGARGALAEAMAYYEEAGDRDRYASALANRAELLFAEGRYGAARSDLQRVLAHDRGPGRERQFVYAAAAWQKLCLLEGDLDGAARVFEEATRRVAGHPEHDAWREALILEAARRLCAGEPASARLLLEEAGRRSDNRMRNEALRLRLLVSASIDEGTGPAPADERALPAGERALLLGERALASGAPVPAEALSELEARLAPAPGETAGRLVEWLARFPAAFSTDAGEPLLALALRAASRSGLLGGRERFARVSALRGRAGPPPGRGPKAGEPPFVAEDPATRAALDLVRRVAPTSLPLLILGETGTGKEELAREAHRHSGRKGPYVAVNVASLSETLLESELFGHVKGAFTGADRDRPGLVEASSGGTLFLDEIGELPPALQAKLLRVLQEREVRRVGETRERKVDLRIVSATHRDLRERMRCGAFREDLYFRLAGVEVRLAPLRERPRDLAAILDGALAARAVLGPRARSRLLSHSWPGNVRELLSAVEAAVALAAPERVIDVAHLPPSVRGADPAVPEGPPEGPTGRRGSYFAAVEEAKRRIIVEALARTGGNRTQAAVRLGLSRQSLVYELRRLGLSAPKGRGR